MLAVSALSPQPICRCVHIPKRQKEARRSEVDAERDSGNSEKPACASSDRGTVVVPASAVLFTPASIVYYSV